MPAGNDQCGYTLVEIMVAAALMGVLVTLSVTSMQTLSLQRQKRAAADELSALLNQARFMARGTSTSATVTVNTVAAAPGGSLVVAIGAPVNWSQTVAFGSANYPSVGLIKPGGGTAAYTITPRGLVIDAVTLAPSTITLTLHDRDYSINGDEVTVSVGLLGDIEIASGGGGGTG